MQKVGVVMYGIFPFDVLVTDDPLELIAFGLPHLTRCTFGKCPVHVVFFSDEERYDSTPSDMWVQQFRRDAKQHLSEILPGHFSIEDYNCWTSNVVYLPDDSPI